MGNDPQFSDLWRWSNLKDLFFKFLNIIFLFNFFSYQSNPKGNYEFPQKDSAIRFSRLARHYKHIKMKEAQFFIFKNVFYYLKYYNNIL